MRTRAFLIVIYLAYFSDAQAAVCPGVFANLTTCGFLNGSPALGSTAQLAYGGVFGVRGLDAQMNATVAVSVGLSKDTTACKAVFLQFACIQATFGQQQIDNGISVPSYATTCKDGAAMKPCRDWCLEVYKTCGKDPYSGDVMAATMCTGDLFATTNCYGNAGAAGMRPGSVGAASSGPVPAYVVLPVALVAASLSAAR